MLPTMGRCFGCNQPTPSWQLRRDSASGYYYCDFCWDRRAEPRIPPGCERRFEFYLRLYREMHRLTEWPNQEVVIPRGEEIPVDVAIVSE